MGDTPICTIDATGIHKPSFADCLTYFQTKYQGIYGTDVYWAPDDRDTQFLSLLAAAIDDTNAETVAAYNSFRPAFSEGAALSSLVKIDGIARKVPSYSVVEGMVVGVVGTTIVNGAVRDADGRIWNLPASVTIPSAGQTVVQITCSELGAIDAQAGEITDIFTPQVGWQSFTNLPDTVTGAPVESDPELRTRQAFSASLPAQTTFDGLRAAIGALEGVNRYRVYQNDDPGPDAFGIPGNRIAVVADGDAQAVVDTIAVKKSGGIPTYGTMVVATSPDSAEISRRLWYSPPEDVAIAYSLSIVPFAGYTTDIQRAVQQALADWTNALGIGNGVQLMDAVAAARFHGADDEDAATAAQHAAWRKTFRIVPDSLLVGAGGAPPAAQDISVAFYQAPLCDPNDVIIALPPT